MSKVRSMTGRAKALSLTAFAVVVTAAASVPVSALPHLRLVKAFPSADTTLVHSPDAVRLWLSEPAELPSVKISVKSVSGAQSALAAATIATEKNAPLVAKVTAPLPEGSYIVTWRAMSRDGHVVNGTIPFKVAATR